MSLPFEKFLNAHEQSYEQALKEIKNCRKTSHWMWWIFPQFRNLGVSETSKNYALQNLEEAKAFLEHPVLGAHLIEISKAVLDCNSSAIIIFGSPDDKKLRSSMTLFSLVPESHPVFKDVLKNKFKGECDSKTFDLLKKNCCEKKTWLIKDEIKVSHQ